MGSQSRLWLRNFTKFIQILHQGDHYKILLSMTDGSTLHWSLATGQVARDAPAAGARRTWSSACALPSGKIMRLASKWRRHPAGHVEWMPELLF